MATQAFASQQQHRQTPQSQFQQHNRTPSNPSNMLIVQPTPTRAFPDIARESRLVDDENPGYTHSRSAADSSSSAFPPQPPQRSQENLNHYGPPSQNSFRPGEGEEMNAPVRQSQYYLDPHGDDDDDGFYGNPNGGIHSNGGSFGRNSSRGSFGYHVDTPPPQGPPQPGSNGLLQPGQAAYGPVPFPQHQQGPNQPPQRDHSVSGRSTNQLRADGAHRNSMRRQTVVGGIDAEPPSPPPVLDHSHLHPGQSASLLSYDKTLEQYRLNAKKTNDPELQFQFAVLMLEAVRGASATSLSSASGNQSVIAPIDPTRSNGNVNQLEIERAEQVKENGIKEAIRMLQRLADRGHYEASYFLADCYANGIGTHRGRQDFDKAYPLFVSAAKHRHADAAYRAGICCENGWGCRRESGKAVQFYRTAATLQHPGAMYRLGLALLNGELGLSKNPKEGVKWLKRSAEHATAEFPHALHELALLHERGIDNVLFVDVEYSAELLAQASELGYAPSAYRLGECYEYGKMGCPQDPALSIHYYNIAAQQNHRDACFALTAWYLVGSPGVLPQSDTEAFLWALKAAEQGLAKAMYAVGYFTEIGLGTVQSTNEALIWYRKGAEAGDKRAAQRLKANNRDAGPLPGSAIGERIPGQGDAGHDRSHLKRGGKNDKDCVIM